MNEKTAAVYNEGWRDGYAAASAAACRPAARVVQLHAAAALTLVVLAAVACIDRATPPTPAPVSGCDIWTYKPGELHSSSVIRFNSASRWVTVPTEFGNTSATLELRDGAWVFSR